MGKECLSGRTRNCYGFLPNSYHFQGFATLLGMDTESTEFQSIKEDLHEMRTTKLNTAYSTKDQMPSLQLIKQELRKRHPRIFEGTYGAKHLYFAIRVIMNYHSRRRYNHGLTAQKKRINARTLSYKKTATAPTNNRRSSRNVHRAKGPVETGEILDLTDDQNTDPDIPNCEAHTGSPSSRLSIPLAPSQPERASTNLPPANEVPSSVASCSTPRLQESTPEYTGSGTASAHTIQQSCPSVSDRQIEPAREDPLSETLLKQTDIYKFLSTCLPPMTHYLRHFVEFGCGTSMHLSSMSHWRTEQRYLTLKRILGFVPRDAQAGSNSPSEMDIAVLENQFSTYFLDD